MKKKKNKKKKKKLRVHIKKKRQKKRTNTSWMKGLQGEIRGGGVRVKEKKKRARCFYRPSSPYHCGRCWGRNRTEKGGRKNIMRRGLYSRAA